MGLLKGKRALITGGTSGLGKEIALMFAEEGADVAILGTNKERAEKVVEAFNAAKKDSEQQFRFDIVNVGSKEEVNRSTETLLKEWRTADILVNCGITRDKLFMKMGEDDWDQVIETNLKLFISYPCACPSDDESAERKIINITSVIGLTGNPGQVNYAASKLGIVGFTAPLQRTWVPTSMLIVLHQGFSKLL